MKKTYLETSITSYKQAAVLAIKAERLPAFFVLILLAGAPLSLTPFAVAEEVDLPKAQVLVSTGLVAPEPNTERKTQTGKIGAKNLSGIAFVYEEQATSSKELWMPFEDGLYLEGYGDVESIVEGDQVKVIYDEYLETPGKFVLRGITLLEQAPEEVAEPEEEIAL